MSNQAANSPLQKLPGHPPPGFEHSSGEQDVTRPFVASRNQVENFLVANEQTSKKSWIPAVIAGVAVGLAVVAVASLLVLNKLADDSVIAGEYIGSSVEDVRTEAKEAGLVAVIEEVRRDGSQAGEILEQTPVAGQELKEGDEINLVVSLGWELRILPSVTGMGVEEATVAIEEAELEVGSITEKEDASAAKGAVIAALVDGEAVSQEVEGGTVVDLVVSSGPEQVEVPRITSTEIQSVLVDELGLVVTKKSEIANLEEGKVIRTDPAAGSSISRGGNITVYVAAAPQATEDSVSPKPGSSESKPGSSNKKGKPGLPNISAHFVLRGAEIVRESGYTPQIITTPPPRACPRVAGKNQCVINKELYRDGRIWKTEPDSTKGVNPPPGSVIKLYGKPFGDSDF